MYVPPRYKIEDLAEIKRFLTSNSFGLLITQGNQKPLATHLPFEIIESANEMKLRAHLAKANTQWKTFAETAEALVVFQGPHAYVSSSWYNHENVPTWNYQAVHVYGKISIISEEELRESLAKLIDKYEADNKGAVKFDRISPKLIAQEIRSIVGFEIAITDIQAKYKLSQNRNKEDYQQVIDQLEKKQDAGANAVAKAMQTIRNEDDNPE